MSNNTTTYKAIASINALDYQIPEIDVAYFNSYVVEASLNIMDDIPYSHRVVLSNIDISANVFKKLFYDQSVNVPTFNTLTNSYTDHTFGLLQKPPSAVDVSYTIFGEPEPRGYYAFLSQFISILPPARTVFQTRESFSLHDQILDNIIADLKLVSSNPNYEGLFNTCSLIDFNQEITNIKTLNDIIPHTNGHDNCALQWNSILEMVRSEYADIDANTTRDSGDLLVNGTVNTIMDSQKYAILMMTIVFKTTMNMHMGEGDLDSFVSTTEVKLRYKMDFAELPEFLATNANGDRVITK
jgi:hypothetical protein